MMQLQRETTEYVDTKRFVLAEKQFTQQFSQIYFIRLAKLRQVTEKAARAKWSGANSPMFLSRIQQLVADNDSVLVGTLYKDMKLKPSILAEYSKERSVAPANSTRLISDDDFLVLEDEVGRVRLVMDSAMFPASRFVTGMVVAVRGRETHSGDFIVSDMCFTGLPNQISLPPLTSDKYVLLLSGIQIGNPKCDPLPLQLLIEYVSGALGDTIDNELGAKIVRVIIAGNSVEPPDDPRFVSKNTFRTQMIGARGQSTLSNTIREFDVIVSQLAASVPVDLMPGPDDPSNYTLPQQPLHPCLFPTASRYQTFQSVTNPYECMLDGVRLLGTSGQTVEDVCRYSDREDRVEIMRDMLLTRHIAPTAPDTLGCYPYIRDDPFILPDCPHIFFCGNQPSYKSSILEEDEKRVQCISVPRFSETGVAVLVNLRTLECQPISFSVSCNDQEVPATASAAADSVEVSPMEM